MGRPHRVRLLESFLHFRAGDVTGVTGLGGTFAVEPNGSAEPPVLSAVHGEPMFDDDNFPALRRT
ncbi:hypothetical protein STVIR_2091 [Streptomyces viridochromogenes Tue57]|uniref:Uncharacterized protein n=1 Tax=Streptomyces viridochromogenes Tue57 TaxID=1160705 RepID=L8PLP6_STRVR|nr:hypothetical protein STVIR_2091 [Streptomyces viridochromogenes Tue57]